VLFRPVCAAEAEVGGVAAGVAGHRGGALAAFLALLFPPCPNSCLNLRLGWKAPVL
jgi:hypothetical protein